MKLKDWCYRNGARTRAIADACGVTTQCVRHWCNGTRRPPPDLETVKAIERLTDGEVTRHELRVDVFGPKPVQQREAA